MGSVIRAGVTLVASAVVAVVAWIVARWMAGAEELAAWPILPAILASLAVLQGAAKLAVVVDWLFGRGGGRSDGGAGRAVPDGGFCGELSAGCGVCGDVSGGVSAGEGKETMKNYGIVGLAFVWSLSAAANSEPFYGTLTGINSGDILDYQCVRISEDKIKCDFVQILFRKEDPSEDRDDMIAAFLESEPDEQELAETCIPFERWDNILAGEIVPEDEHTVAARTIIEEMEKAKAETPEYYLALKAQMDAWGAFCINQTAESFGAIIDAAENYAAQTCSTWVNRYSQEFREVDDHTWAVESAPPFGPCGIVNTSKFVNDGEYPDLWSYFASKVVTNKEVEDPVPCAELDENENPYLWNAPPVFKNCVFFD